MASASRSAAHLRQPLGGTGRPSEGDGGAHGHASVQITLDRYSHVMPRLTAALAERLDAVYRAAEPASLVAGRAGANNPVATLRPG